MTATEVRRLISILKRAKPTAAKAKQAKLTASSPLVRAKIYTRGGKLTKHFR